MSHILLSDTSSRWALRVMLTRVCATIKSRAFPRQACTYCFLPSPWTVVGRAFVMNMDEQVNANK